MARKSKPKKADAKKSDPELDALEADAAPQASQDAGDAPAQDGGEAPDGAPMLRVLAQYVKDMSFENPGAPDSLRPGQAQPAVNIDLRIGRRVFEDNSVEVTILMRAVGTRDEATLFIAELEYAGLFAIANIGMEQVQPLMMIECPRILFPYARKILGDMTDDGGFPPVMMDMPDFAGMFREEMMRRAAEAPVN